MLDEGSNTLFLTELVRGLMLTMRVFFEPTKLTVRACTCSAVDQSCFLLASYKKSILLFFEPTKLTVRACT